jgi:hypothetical protein
MDLTAVMAEVAVAGRTVSGLACYEWEEPGRFPAGVVGFPERVIPNSTYGRGVVLLEDLPFLLHVGKAHLRSASKLLTDYLKDTGPKSVVAALQNYAYTTVDHVTVTYVDFETYTLKGGDYLTATFHLNLAGRGA